MGGSGSPVREERVRSSILLLGPHTFQDAVGRRARDDAREAQPGGGEQGPELCFGANPAPADLNLGACQVTVRAMTSKRKKTRVVDFHSAVAREMERYLRTRRYRSALSDRRGKVLHRRW